jgi:hypothetical protein
MAETKAPITQHTLYCSIRLHWQNTKSKKKAKHSILSVELFYTQGPVWLHRTQPWRCLVWGDSRKQGMGGGVLSIYSVPLHTTPLEPIPSFTFSTLPLSHEFSYATGVSMELWEGGRLQQCVFWVQMPSIYFAVIKPFPWRNEFLWSN